MSLIDGSKKEDAAPVTIEGFMAQALAMEVEAVQRYDELADSMEVHNNREVAALFRKMADVERKHCQQIMDEMGWREMPPLHDAPVWEGFEAAESVPTDEVHYLMRPWHALELALRAEERAERFYEHLASVATVDAVRKAALELKAEEREHVELIKAWIKKVPQPDTNWAEDPDPPRYDD